MDDPGKFVGGGLRVVEQLPKRGLSTLSTSIAVGARTVATRAERLSTPVSPRY